jgi:hypothetical protein
MGQSVVPIHKLGRALHILGIGGIAQDAQGQAKGAVDMAFDQFAEGGFVMLGDEPKQLIILIERTALSGEGHLRHRPDLGLMGSRRGQRIRVGQQV